ncbi:restriction endonuclease [Pseudarthrobacter sp. 1G09]|uniref:restriction endonuclease n=1 Tax=Pseudarthrobacter sp. 1G09 TaxID=3416178 RepID=UPI003CF389AA
MEEVSDFREYENGIADVVEFLVGDTAKVTRNAHVPGFRTKIDRQIDVLVEGKQFGIHDSMLIIDCKKYATKLDVNDVGTFASMVEDVRANAGWLVTTKGYSDGAMNEAETYRGLGVHVMPVDELLKWRPKGTGLAVYALKSEEDLQTAAKAVRAKGFRARVASSEEAGQAQEDESFLEVFRYYGPSPDGVLGNRDILEVTGNAMTEAGIASFRVCNSGVVVGGGTPGHRHLRLMIKGQPTDVLLNVASDEEAREQIAFFEQQGLFKEGAMFGGYTPDDLDIERPEVWPIPGLFPDQLGL